MTSSWLRFLPSQKVCQNICFSQERFIWHVHTCNLTHNTSAITATPLKVKRTCCFQTWTAIMACTSIAIRGPCTSVYLCVNIRRPSPNDRFRPVSDQSHRWNHVIDRLIPGPAFLFGHCISVSPWIQDLAVPESAVGHRCQCCFSWTFTAVFAQGKLISL